MAHYVKCFYCNQTFDADKEPFVKVNNRRYAHQKCEQEHNANMTQEDKDLEALEAYILKLFNIPYISVKIKRQIENYHNEKHYSYSGILKTLDYWFNIKHNTLDQTNGGIGIVPYVYDQAEQYYYNLYMAQHINQDKNIQEYKPHLKIITIPPPQTIDKQPRMFFEGEENNV